MHWPAELREPWSWYCHRETSAGCQHEPAAVLHGTGAGSAAVATAGAWLAAWRTGAGRAHAGAAAKAPATSAAMTNDPSMRTRCMATPVIGLSEWYRSRLDTDKSVH